MSDHGPHIQEGALKDREEEKGREERMEKERGTKYEFQSLKILVYLSSIHQYCIQQVSQTTIPCTLLLTFEVYRLTRKASEYRETQGRHSILQCLITPIKFGQSFLNKRHPQLLLGSLRKDGGLVHVCTCTYMNNHVHSAL